MTSILRTALALSLLSGTMAANAVDFTLGDGLQGKFAGSLSLGTSIRTEAPAPGNYGAVAANRIGAPAGELSGNGDSADLNFRRGDAVSTALIGHFDLTLKQGNFDVFVRTLAWYDYALKDGKRPYGNITNGFTRNVPLSDAGFDREARFTNVLFEEASVHGRFNVGDDAVLDARVGRQLVNWGVAQFFGNGINIINPPDTAGAVRAGSHPSDGKVPVGMVATDLSLGKTWGVAAIVPYEFHPVIFPGCGTFINTSGGYPAGCNFISLISSVDEATALARGIYLHRQPDIASSGGGQFGLSVRYDALEIGARFTAYAMNYHSRIPLLRGTIANVAGGYGTLAPDFTRLSDPQGIRYALIYPENIRLYGVSVDARLDPTLRVFGEIAYRPNQVVEYNTADVALALLTRSPLSALNLALGVNQLPPGSHFDDYTRFKTTVAIAGVNKVFPATLGSEKVVAAAEIGWSHVVGLPDPGVLRFGRSENYGAPAIDGYPCVDNSLAQKACTHDGLVTTNAWGYRLRLAATYSAMLAGAIVTPSVYFSHDVRGTSEDNMTFIQGRQLLRPALRADWREGYYAELAYTRMVGGAYNLRSDRDSLLLVGGVNF